MPEETNPPDPIQPTPPEDWQRALRMASNVQLQRQYEYQAGGNRWSLTVNPTVTRVQAVTCAREGCENPRRNRGTLCYDCNACDRCRDIYPMDALEPVAAGGDMCPSCVRDFYRRCEGEDCSVFVHVDDSPLCDDCTSEELDYYDDPFSGAFSPESRDTVPGTTPVPFGYDANCRRDANGRPIGGVNSCSCCYNEEWDRYELLVGRPASRDRGYARAQRLIQSYSYRPTYVFSGAEERSKALFLGPEIEVEMSNSRIHNYDKGQAAQIAVDRLGDLGYLKEDGSLDNGFEIIHHPMTYAWAMESFPWQMLPELHAAGARGNSRAGIHIHVNRTGFSSPCHIYRWLKFVYRNREMTIAVAGRESGQWAKFDTANHRANHKYFAKQQTQRAPVPPTSAQEAEIQRRARERRGNELRYADNYPSDRQRILPLEEFIRDERNRFERQREYIPMDRYSAINVTNPHTFELRIFKSSLKVAEVKSFFAFAASTVEYTRQLSANDVLTKGGWKWDGFASWLADNPIYEPLTTRLATL